MSDDSPKVEHPEEPEDRARRRLLKMALYVPPVVVGTIVLGGSGCQATTCPPFFCTPNGTCGPNRPCNPNNCNPNNP